MKNTWIFIPVALFIIFGCKETQSIETTSEPLEMELVWADEFNTNGLPDSAKWSYDYGDACELPCGCGWGNNEAQFYTKDRTENARIENGKLIIEAHKEKWESREYTSARIVSKYKGDWLYGRVEALAKTATGRGAWSALWMLPTDSEHGGWPLSGEIDILEHVGFAPDSIYGTVHTGAYNGMLGTQVGGKVIGDDWDEVFHLYAIDWNEEKIVFSIDNKPFFTFSNSGENIEKWPFDQPFHMILNLAVGGNWGGKEGIDDTIWPQKMEVDYVRVYQKKEAGR